MLALGFEAIVSLESSMALASQLSLTAVCLSATNEEKTASHENIAKLWQSVILKVLPFNLSTINFRQHKISHLLVSSIFLKNMPTPPAIK